MRGKIFLTSHSHSRSPCHCAQAQTGSPHAFRPLSFVLLSVSRRSRRHWSTQGSLERRQQQLLPIQACCLFLQLLIPERQHRLVTIQVRTQLASILRNILVKNLSEKGMLDFTNHLARRKVGRAKSERWSDLKSGGMYLFRFLKSLNVCQLVLSGATDEHVCRRLLDIRFSHVSITLCDITVWR